MLDMDVIYREYADSVFRFLMTLCREECTAEELTQETFTGQCAQPINMTEPVRCLPGSARSLSIYGIRSWTNERERYIHAGGKYGLRQGRTRG